MNQTVPLEFQSVPETGLPKSAGNDLYLVILFGLPLLLLPLAVLMARTNWYLNHNTAPGIRAVGYAALIERADCEIVIYGDSTGEADLDPQLLTRLTGMKTCNLSENRRVIIAAGFMPLDRYLERNPPPRYLVIMLGGRDLLPNLRWESEPTLIEGIQYLVRFEFNARTLAVLARHPVLTYDFAAWTSRALIGYPDWRLRAFFRHAPIDDPLEQRRRRNGSLLVSNTQAQTRCGEGYTTPPDPSDPAWLGSLRQKYALRGSRVLIEIAPIPECDAYREDFERNTRGLTDNRLEILPVNMFKDHDLHLTAEGAAYFSTELAHSILNLEREHPAKGASNAVQ